MGARINGVGFPFRLGPNGIPASATDSDAIKSDLFVLLNTGSATRVMRPELRVDLAKLVFENNGPLLVALIRQTLSSGIKRFEPRVRLLSINVVESKTTVTTSVVYLVLGFKDTLTVNIDKTTGNISMDSK